MAKKRTDASGIENSRGKVTGQKRKGQQNMQLFMNETDYRRRLQEVTYAPEYVLTKIFRKDGPTLGDQFDCLPSNASFCEPGASHHNETQLAHKRRKVAMHAILDYESCIANNSPVAGYGLGKGPVTAKGAPMKKQVMGKSLVTRAATSVKKHGIGKGLMTLMAARGKKHGIGKGLMTLMSTSGVKHGHGKGLIAISHAKNPGARGFLYDPDYCDISVQKKKKGVLRESVGRKLAKKELAKKKTCTRSKKMTCQNVVRQKQLIKEKCELAIADVKRIENVEQFAILLDDEELELRELRAGSNTNTLSCCVHFPTNGSHGCSLCKDLLAKFPPNSVTMKLPLPVQPWASSPELVNKLFKVFHFLCTYAVTISIHSFTLDGLAQAFHDKDSLLLSQVHLSLIRLLLLNIEKEMSSRFVKRAIKNCKFLGLLHSLEHHGLVLEFWQKSLNLLTWSEILRQVFVKAGFGSKFDMARKENCHKEVNLMDKYSLSPGTLKGQLFCILLSQVNSRMEVSELAKSPSIVQLNLTDDLHNLEDLITSTLSGDITLFEKISSSGYRLRTRVVEKEVEDNLSDGEGFGSGDDISEVTGGNDAIDSEHESRESSPSKVDADSSNFNMLTEYNEIDESHPGEGWLLGLMEGEYSDLSIEEKLNALTALIDLLIAGPSFGMEDPLAPDMHCPPNNNPYGSGGKIKRSTAKQCNSFVVSGASGGKNIGAAGINTPEQPIDSLVAVSQVNELEKHEIMTRVAIDTEAEDYLHPMQSIFLGSDRRYNRYWLFLGPCDEYDPGHRRIYFESSEDGHWEIVDSKEAFCSLYSSLDRRGAREARLLASLENIKAVMEQSMSNTPNDTGNKQLSHSDESSLTTSRDDGSSPVSDADNVSISSEMQIKNSTSAAAAGGEYDKKGNQQVEKLVHSQTFDAYIWKSFYHELGTVKKGKKACLDLLRRCDQCQDLYWRDEKHCRVCHETFELDLELEERYAVHSAMCRVNFDTKKFQRKKVMPSQLQALKAAIYAIESAIPEEALLASWKRSVHNLWINRLRRASNLKEFLQVHTDFVTAINEDWFYQNNILGSYCALDELFSNFSTVPQTYSAVALWLVKLDLLVASHLEKQPI